MVVKLSGHLLYDPGKLHTDLAQKRFKGTTFT